MADKIYTIEEIKAAVTPIAQSYGVKRMALFGSYARGNATERSDIDIHLIDRGDIRGYFKLCGFRSDLEERLGVSVDVLTTGAMDVEVLDRIKKDEVVIYER